MATLTDLVVELEIDADGLTAGARRAADRVNRDLGSINHTMRTVETTSRQTSDGVSNNFVRGFARIRQVGRRTGMSVFSSIADSFTRLSGRTWLIVGVIAAALATLPAVATGVAGAIVLALGGGLAAIGLVAAAQSKRVKRSFSGLKEHVVSELKRMAEPFEPTLLAISDMFRDVFDTLAPALEQAFSQMAPALTRFVKQLGEAFKQLEPVIPILTNAFIKLMDALGPRLPEIFKAIGDAIIEISNVMAENPDLFASLIVGLFKLLPIVAKIVAALVKVYKWMTENATILRILMSVMMLAIGTFEWLRGAITVLGAVVGWIKTQFTRFKNAVTRVWNALKNAVKTAIDNIRNTISRLSQIPGRVRAWFERMRSAAVNRARALVSWMRGLPGRILSALSRLGSMMWNAGRNIVQAMINGIKSMVGRLAGAARSLASTVRNMLPFSPAKEGPLAGSGAPENSGAAIAAQLGAGIMSELAAVDRAADAMMSQLDGALSGHAASLRDAGGDLTVDGPRAGARMRPVPAAEPTRVVLDVTGTDEDMKRLIRRMVRVDGGDVQAVLGGRR